MEKVCLTLLVVVLFFSSCKKEDENQCPKGCGGVTTHYAYVKGVVADSITGLPLPNAIVYSSYLAFSSGDSSIDTTDVNGAYTKRIVWYVGRSLYSGLLSRPEDSTDLYINSYSNNSCNFLKIKWGQLIENDTIALPTISVKPYAYVSAHVKDTLPISYGIYLSWSPYPKYGGTPSVLFNANSDTVVTRQICPHLNTYVCWAYGVDSVFVNSGDTAFVNVFY